MPLNKIVIFELSDGKGIELSLRRKNGRYHCGRYVMNEELEKIWNEGPSLAIYCSEYTQTTGKITKMALGFIGIGLPRSWCSN
jgi:hypothetical protein